MYLFFEFAVFAMSILRFMATQLNVIMSLMEIFATVIVQGIRALGLGFWGKKSEKTERRYVFFFNYII